MAVSNESLTNSMIKEITRDEVVIKNYRKLRSKSVIKHNLTGLSIYLGSKNTLIWDNDLEKIEALRKITNSVRIISKIYNDIEYVGN